MEWRWVELLVICFSDYKSICYAEAWTFFSPQPRELIRYIVNQKKFRRGMSFWFVAISWFDPMMWIKIYALFLIIFIARAINDPTYLSRDTEHVLKKFRERIFHAQPIGRRNYVDGCSRSINSLLSFYSKTDFYRAVGRRST